MNTLSCFSKLHSGNPRTGESWRTVNEPCYEHQRNGMFACDNVKPQTISTYHVQKLDKQFVNPGRKACEFRPHVWQQLVTSTLRKLFSINHYERRICKGWEFMKYEYLLNNLNTFSVWFFLAVATITDHKGNPAWMSRRTGARNAWSVKEIWAKQSSSIFSSWDFWLRIHEIVLPKAYSITNLIMTSQNPVSSVDILSSALKSHIIPNQEYLLQGSVVDSSAEVLLNRLRGAFDNVKLF